MQLANRIVGLANGMPNHFPAQSEPAGSPILPFGNGGDQRAQAERKPRINGKRRRKERKRAKSASDRDAATGRFAAGNQAAVGHVNRTARARAELQKALITAVTPADMEALAKRLLTIAIAGDVPSAELLLKYVIGRPAKAEDPDRVTLEAWRLIQSWPIMAEFVVALTNNINPEVAANLGVDLVAGTVKKIMDKLNKAEDSCDAWGNPFLGKQTDAIIGRRLTKGK